MNERVVVKEEKYAKLYSDGTILFKEVRASHPHLDKPWAGAPTPQNPNPQPKFSIRGLAPKGGEYKPSVFLVRDYINKIASEAKLPELPPNMKFLQDGKAVKPSDPLFVNSYHMSANENPNRPPVLRDQRMKPVTPEQAARLFYGGCVVNLLIRPWVQNNGYGKRVNANLLAVQFVKDDEAFGKGRISDDVIDDSFGPIDDDDSGFDDELGSTEMDGL